MEPLLIECRYCRKVLDLGTNKEEGRSFYHSSVPYAFRYMTVIKCPGCKQLNIATLKQVVEEVEID